MLKITREDMEILGFSTIEQAEKALRRFMREHKYVCKRCKERFTSLNRMDLHFARGCGNV